MPRMKILILTLWIEIMKSKSLFQNALILRRPRGPTFTRIIKTATMFIKTTFKD